jgi:PAS domain S-box-containing protein
MERRFETLFQQAPFSLQLLSVEGRTLRVNRAWELLWGANDANGIKQYVLDEYNVFEDPQLQASGVSADLRRAVAGESVELPTIYYDPAKLGRAGRARWVRAFAHPVKEEDGSVREVMLIHEDITDRVEADTALRRSEERLRLALLAGNIGTWEWDVERDVVTWSDEVYALHAMEIGSFGGTAGDFARLVHPDDRAEMWRRIDSAIARGSGFSADFRVVLADGRTRWLSTWAQIHRPGGGQGPRMIGATLSIDAYKNAEAALREADKRKDEFLAMLAHELRNPLAPISSAAQLLRMGLADPAKVQRASDVITRQVNHITKLVDDLLDVSRVTRGLIRLDQARVDLSGVVDAAIEQTLPHFEARGHALQRHADGSDVFVRGDRARLIQIVANVLNNASRYTPPGGRITVELRAEGPTAAIRVSDTGQGIEPELLPRVFELFTQGERPPDALGGLGIGLSLVRRLTQLHGGTVHAESEGPGRGSTFIIRLPRERDESGGPSFERRTS